MTENKPLAVTIPYLDAIDYAAILSQNKGLVFLDSAKPHPHFGRYSFIMFDPFATIVYKNNQIIFGDKCYNNQDIFALLSKLVSQYNIQIIPELPPFQGGIAGFFSYDLARDLEQLPEAAIDDMNYPRLMLGLYDLIISFDHFKKQAWIVSNGLPETKHSKRQQRAKLRLQWCWQQLDAGKTEKGKWRNNEFIAEPMIKPDQITSNFSKAEYLSAIQKTIDYILAGDIFEANISQRFQCIKPEKLTPFMLYQRIRKLNAAPFSAYIDFADVAIVSSSPERFLKLHDGTVESRPIKGTQKRSLDPEEDKFLAKQLINSKKDNAENTMIVDLMRNDLSKVCEAHTVKVPQFCQLESYETVHHLVSAVEGKLKTKYNAIDLLKATFPGGSITGAPKIRTMEIIDELEPTRRGPYCGSIGYIGFDGSMDTSIVIRTYIVKDQIITFQAGGAIVLDSDPEQEYNETLIKVSALKTALTKANTPKAF